MKQLKFMLAAATAIGLATATQAATVNENFNGYTTDMKGAAITNVVYDSNNQTLISGIPGFSFEGTEGDNESAIVADGENDMALNVNMGTDPLLCQLDIGSRVDLTEENLQSLNIDTMVQFTVTPETDEVLPGLTNPNLKDDEGNVVLKGNIKEDKLLIFLQEKTVGETKSNVLKVWASSVKMEEVGFDEYETSYVPNVVEIPGVEVVPNQWYRLQVKAYLENEIVLFSIKLGDTELASSEALYSDASKGTKAFPSLLGTASTLTYVGFAGEGKVDDLVVTKSYLATNVDFTLALGEGVSAVSYTVGNTSGTLPDENGAISVALNGTAVVVNSITYAPGYVEGTNLAGSYPATKDGTITIDANKNASVKNDGNTTATGSEVGFAETVFAATTGSTLEAVVAWTGSSRVSTEVVKSMQFSTTGTSKGDPASAAGTDARAAEEAFLLNCAPSEVEDEKAEFVFSATDLAKLMDPNNTENLDIQALKETKKYIGDLILEGATELGNWHDKAEGDTFFRARLVFPGSQN